MEDHRVGRVGLHGHFLFSALRRFGNEYDQAVLQGKDTAIGPALYLSFELGDKAWKLTFGDGRRNPDA